VRIFAATEAQINFHLHVRAQKINGAGKLEIEVVLFAAWAELDFLHLVGLGGLFVLLFLFGFLVFVLAEIAHAANRRARVGCHLHEIEPVPLG